MLYLRLAKTTCCMDIELVYIYLRIKDKIDFVQNLAIAVGLAAAANPELKHFQYDMEDCIKIMASSVNSLRLNKLNAEMVNSKDIRNSTLARLFEQAEETAASDVCALATAGSTILGAFVGSGWDLHEFRANDDPVALDIFLCSFDVHQSLRNAVTTLKAEPWMEVVRLSHRHYKVSSKAFRECYFDQQPIDLQPCFIRLGVVLVELRRYIYRSIHEKPSPEMVDLRRRVELVCASYEKSKIKDMCWGFDAKTAWKLV